MTEPIVPQYGETDEQFMDRLAQSLFEQILPYVMQFRYCTGMDFRCYRLPDRLTHQREAEWAVEIFEVPDAAGRYQGYQARLNDVCRVLGDGCRIFFTSHCQEHPEASAAIAARWQNRLIRLVFLHEPPRKAVTAVAELRRTVDISGP